MANEANPYLTQSNPEEQPCGLCGGGENHDPACPEMHRCSECFALVEGGEDHDSQCFRAAEARAERSAERNAELVGELLSIARAAGGGF